MRLRRYLLRRCLQTVPTLAGVLLLTFALFHVVGGSPAETMLGKNASAQDLENLETLRGFNKPLLVGRWNSTRAFADTAFARAAPDGAPAGSGGVPPYVAPGERAPLALAMPLRPGERYRWRLRILSTGGGATLERGGTDGANPSRIAASPKPQTVVVDFTAAGDESADRFALRAGEQGVRLESIRLRRRNAHPFDSQFGSFLAQLARLDLGTSIETRQSVASLLRRGALPSLALTVPIFLGSLALALCLALVCGHHRNRWPDRLLVLAATTLMSVNYVVWVVAGQYLLGFRLDWFPVWGFESWRHLALPVLIGIATAFGRDLRLYRAVVVEEINRDYVRTAKAKGAGPARILFVHVLPNVAIPVVTHVSLSLPFLFTGSLLLESFFGIPGLGSAGINAIHASDLDVVRALVLIGSLLYMAVNLLADVCYAWMDPRVRLG